MNQDPKIETYLRLIAEKANELEIEPHFLDVLVTLLATGNRIRERVFLTCYYVRLAHMFTTDSRAGMISDRPDLVQCAKLGLQEPGIEALSLLSRDDEIILNTWRQFPGGDGKIRQNHLVALVMAKEDIEEQKARYGKQDFDALVNDVLLAQIQPIIKQKQKILAWPCKSSA